MNLTEERVRNSHSSTVDAIACAIAGVDPKLQELLSRASVAIERGEGQLREAARLLFEANHAGVSQRQIAEIVCRAQSWVSRLIRWHRAGATGTPFGPESKRRREAAQADPSTDHRRRAAPSPVGNNDSPDSMFHLLAEEQAAAVEITRLWLSTTQRVRRYLSDKLVEANEVSHE